MSTPITAVANKSLPALARAGLIAKGLVYILLGLIVLLNTTEISKQKSAADKTGVFETLRNNFAGQWLIPLLALGLLCYSIWRWTEAFKLVKEKEHLKKAIRYFFSGAVYILVCYTAVELMLNTFSKNGDNEQEFAHEALTKPFGQWLLGISAVVLAAIGVYQAIYGLSEKYRKHVQELSLQEASSKILLLSGKIGYVSRGIVWITMAYLMMRAALSGSSKEAGDTNKVFHFIESSWGSPVLAVVALGLIAYGVFNGVRARYEHFDK
jgi:uncharacterized membrane protein YiaA